MHGRRESVHRTGARAPGIAAPAAGRRTELCLSRAAGGCAHGEDRELFLEFVACARRTGRLRRALHNGFESMIAMTADVFEDGHTHEYNSPSAGVAPPSRSRPLPCVGAFFRFVRPGLLV